MTTPSSTGLQSPYEILGLLFPGLPATRTSTRGLSRTPAGHRRLTALPNVDDTRMFLPVEAPLAASALRRARRSIDLRGRLVTSTAATGLRLGLGRLLRAQLDVPLSRDSVDAQLADLLDRDVRTAIFLGPPRSNRKPVLQVLGSRGELLAVAKAGINDLTSELARAEAMALRTVGARGFATVVPPLLLGEGKLHGHSMVVQSPLDVPDGHAEPGPSQLTAVFDEIARSGGTTNGALQDSAYLERLRGRLVAAPTAEMSSLGSSVLDSLAASGARLDFGSWHGDLSPWNLAAADGDRVLVWDWERFTEGVPVGFDALHYAFLPRLKDPGTPQARVGLELLDRAPQVLEGVGVAADQAPVVGMLYLLEVGIRFAGDGQAGTGILGGDVEQWLVPAMKRHLAQERT